MKKRIIAVVWAVLMIALLNGCGKQSTEGIYFTEGESARFKTIERQAWYFICVDRDTGVEYLGTSDGHMTVLVDREWNPLIANGWRDYDG